MADELDMDTLIADLQSGKAALTMAVMQFSDNPKLQAFTLDTDVAKLLSSLDDDDPFVLREMPAFGGTKQYLLLSRDTKLPFNEEGLTKKQGEDELARAMAREQLAVYAEKFPWTAQMIKVGLARAEQADCHGCVEKRLVGEVAQAVKDRLDSKHLVARDQKSDEPDMWGAREPCPLCTLKHLAQAVVLLNESINGYPTHRWYAVGHIAEAEAEAPSHDMAVRIRQIRLDVMDNLDIIPDFREIIEELDATIRG